MKKIKKLYKSNTDKKLCGVCGGIGEYLSIDSTIIRLLWIVITLLGGAGVMAYIICALIMPEGFDYPDFHDDEFNDF